MKKVLITAGGTATAWHLCSVAQEYFKNDLMIYICDSNPPELVPASMLACKTFQVPVTTDKDYLNVMQKFILEEGIECIIPLIPHEGILMASDGDFCKNLGLLSTAPCKNTFNRLADKAGLYDTLCEMGIDTPRLFNAEDLENDKTYLIKPRLGFGSLDIKKEKGIIIKEIYKEIKDDYIISEYIERTNLSEITVEVYNDSDKPRIFARERISTKNGVCVKAKAVDTSMFYDDICKLISAYECPVAFNVQYFCGNGVKCLFDCNLRLGAGTALSTTMGFQLARALLVHITDQDVSDTLFDVDDNIKYAVRVYEEIAIR